MKKGKYPPTYSRDKCVIFSEHDLTLFFTFYY